MWPAIVRDNASAGGSPLSIEALRQRSFQPSEIRLHRAIERNDDYTQYLMTHDSDGLRITGGGGAAARTGAVPGGGAQSRVRLPGEL